MSTFAIAAGQPHQSAEQVATLVTNRGGAQNVQAIANLKFLKSAKVVIELRECVLLAVVC